MRCKSCSFFGNLIYCIAVFISYLGYSCVCCKYTIVTGYFNINFIKRNIVCNARFVVVLFVNIICVLFAFVCFVKINFYFAVAIAVQRIQFVTVCSRTPESRPTGTTQERG